MSRKVIIYTRYSSDMQSPKSCEDQEREVRQFLERLGIDHRQALVIHDREESGTKTYRSEFERLIEMLRNREIGLLAVDDQARLTRANNAYNFITDIVFEGGRWLSTGENIDTDQRGWELRVKVMELHNSTTISELGHRVRRGQAGRLLANLTAGDYPFGYESYLLHPERVYITARGPKPEKNVRISEVEARWVRQIVRWFLELWSLTAIADELTRLGVGRGKRCREKAWSTQQVRKILSNAKYIGLWIWGTTKTIRNSSGKSKQVPVPSSEWVRVHRPDLRIIEQEDWDRVQERLAELDAIYGYKDGQKKRGPRAHHSIAYPTSLLQGLIFCECGARMHYCSSGKRIYFACPKTGTYPGACTMRTQVRVDKAKAAILEVLELLLQGQPDFLRATFAATEKAITEASSTAPMEIEANQRALVEVEKQVETLLDNLSRVRSEGSATVFARLNELEGKAEQLREQLRKAKESLVETLHLPDQQWVADQLRDLAALIEEDEGRAAILLRKLFGRVIAHQVLPPGKSRGYARLQFQISGWDALRTVLPADIAARLGALVKNNENSETAATFSIDLGAPTAMDQWAPQIAAWREQKVPWEEIWRRTGLGSGPAYTCWKRFVDAQRQKEKEMGESDDPQDDLGTDSDTAA